MKAAEPLNSPCISRDFEQEATTQGFPLRWLCCDFFVSRFLVTFKCYCRFGWTFQNTAINILLILLTAVALSEFSFFRFWHLEFKTNLDLKFSCSKILNAEGSKPLAKNAWQSRFTTFMFIVFNFFKKCTLSSRTSCIVVLLKDMLL